MFNGFKYLSILGVLFIATSAEFLPIKTALGSQVAECQEPLIIYLELSSPTQDIGTSSLRCITDVESVELVGNDGIRDFALSPDGFRLAYVVSEKDISSVHIYNLVSDVTTKLVQENHTLRLSWISNHQLFISSWDHFPNLSGNDFAQQYWVYDTDSDNTEEIDAPRGKFIDYVEDGELFIFANYELGLFSMNQEGLISTIELPYEVNSLEFAISKDGATVIHPLACEGGSETRYSCFTIYERSTRELTFVDELAEDSFSVGYPVYSPDNRYVAFTIDNSRVAVYDLGAGQVVYISNSDEYKIGYRWLDNENTLLISSITGPDDITSRESNIYALDIDQLEMEQLTDTPSSKSL